MKTGFYSVGFLWMGWAALGAVVGYAESELELKVAPPSSLKQESQASVMAVSASPVPENASPPLPEAVSESSEASAGVPIRAFPSVWTTDRIEAIKKHIEQILEGQNRCQGLLLLDVDDVLIYPALPFDFKCSHRRTLMKNLEAQYLQKGRGEEFDCLRAAILRARSQDPHSVQWVEGQSTQAFLKWLQEQKIPTLGLSSYRVGRFGDESAIDRFRFKDLDHLGFSFQPLAPPGLPIQARFEVEDSQAGVSQFLFLHGLILTNGFDKGQTFEAFLKRYPRELAWVIFVDDHLPNVLSIQAACQRLRLAAPGGTPRDAQGRVLPSGTPAVRGQFHYYGVHYKGVQHLQALRSSIELNLEQEKERFAFLQRERVWLSDEALQERLQRQEAAKDSDEKSL